jgi:hypothetical protein
MGRQGANGDGACAYAKDSRHPAIEVVAQRSHREAARRLGVSPGTVASAVSRARAQALTWEAEEALSDDALGRTLYGPTPTEIDGARPEPDLAWIHRELRAPGLVFPHVRPIRLRALRYGETSPKPWRGRGRRRADVPSAPQTR